MGHAGKEGKGGGPFAQKHSLPHGWALSPSLAHCSRSLLTSLPPPHVGPLCTTVTLASQATISHPCWAASCHATGAGDCICRHFRTSMCLGSGTGQDRGPTTSPMPACPGSGGARAFGHACTPSPSSLACLLCVCCGHGWTDRFGQDSSSLLHLFGICHCDLFDRMDTILCQPLTGRQTIYTWTFAAHAAPCCVSPTYSHHTPFPTFISFPKQLPSVPASAPTSSCLFSLLYITLFSSSSYVSTSSTF